MATRVVTTHLPADLARKLDVLAGRLDRPRGWLVKEAVEAYVGLAEERDRETRAALDEVAAGRVLEHAEVAAWADSLTTARRRRKRAG
ncbi:MAG: ribbon-helix-helix protein, CopG family [Gammaproteobacteria bacterium]|nr:ribbon-helix-helix protein, CopG family [Gammaproteobacteria bacterium]